uniref:Replication-associated protein n=1 Tax=Periparus ater Circoviridae sp. TaxID=2815004 RepID=A0A8A4XC72_9CIRC|nr:MAG: replication-associated protein [Periparus ater Circoviridae sp.]
MSAQLRAVNNRSKYWCFTSFDVQNAPLQDRTGVQYLVIGREVCPETTREHLQCFVAFKNRQRFNQVREKLGNAHIERMRGTPEEAANYCKKDGNFTEFGTLPKCNGGDNAFRKAIELAEKGELDAIKENYSGIYLRYKKTIDCLRRFNTDELMNSCGVWINGPPRIGKDYAVKQLGSDNVFCKNNSKWWDGYKGEPYVLLSDVEPSHGSWLGYFLKIWSDRYPFTAEIKGGVMKIRPRRIFVTSNYKIETVFCGEVLAALNARFDVHDFTCPSMPEYRQRAPSVINRTVLSVLQQKDEVFKDVQTCSTTPPVVSPPPEVPCCFAQGDTPEAYAAYWADTTDFQMPRSIPPGF